ncbi:two-component system LytT family response regulator [Chitinophaga dinghuensis]|uniref:Two-component system LytT family response regulator n=1 Tax=Chitinophaga dinghuensis TaxID=1539050 RepID=A0A327WJN9_9BACT|nr:LytTR family DNA-binding domain-containing protein [Chitinophaga dinghuensis]RAJ88004.1 two-component system LytT family response regulator [Chitinophaga dinghuensis]
MTVYILEDETNIQKHIIALVAQIPYLQLIGYAADIVKAEKEIPQLKPDLILSDIQLKDDTCFNLFNRIDISAMQVLFITAYDQYAIQALNLGACGYLLKPLDTELFNETIDRCFRKTEQHKFNQYQLEIAATHYRGNARPRRIALKSAAFTQVINIEDIVYCSSDKGYTTFWLKDGTSILVSKVLKEYESVLPPDTFLRCHQSFLVNGHFVNKFFKDGYLEMTTGAQIPVSERKKDSVASFLERM